MKFHLRICTYGFVKKSLWNGDLFSSWLFSIMLPLDNKALIYQFSRPSTKFQLFDYRIRVLNLDIHKTSLNCKNYKVRFQQETGDCHTVINFLWSILMLLVYVCMFSKIQFNPRQIQIPKTKIRNVPGLFTFSSKVWTVLRLYWVWTLKSWDRIRSEI